MEELASHYRRLCKLYHPDLQAPDQRAEYERHMQAINEAYSRALERFNILTFRNPRKPDSQRASVHQDVFSSTPPRTDPAPPPPQEQASTKQTRNATAYAAGEAARALGRALAVLNDARTFNSFKAAGDDRERAVYHKALPMLRDVARRFPSLREGQDALFYTAVCECNMRGFGFALHTFHQYRLRYPNDRRGTLLHFYCGICHHRMRHFEDAIREYEQFMQTQPSGMFKHFLVVVAGFHTAAQRGEFPADRPYA